MKLKTPPSNAAFTLLETIGALGLLTIIISLLLPVVFKSIARTQRAKESKDLKHIVAGIEKMATTQFRLPDAENWDHLVAESLGWSLQQTSLNHGGWNRRMVLDPQMQQQPGESFGLPYQQEAHGSAQPSHARALLVSCLTSEISPTWVVDHFDLCYQGDKHTIHAARQNGWQGTQEDIMIYPINLAPWFHRLILSNLDDEEAYFQINDSESVTLPPGSLLDTHYLTHTAVGLRLNDQSLQSTSLVEDTECFLYQDGRWRRGFNFFNGSEDALSELVNAFLRVPRHGKFSVEARDVVTELHAFLLHYSLWAAEGFPLGGASSQQVPEYRRSYDAQFRLFDFIDQLLAGA